MADQRIPKFLRREGNSLLYNGDGEFIFYVPEILFQRKDAFLVGEYVNIMGLLDYAIYDKSGKTDGIRRFMFPTVFLCKPSSIDKVKQIKLKAGVEPQDYRLLRFTDGDAVVVDISVPKDIENAENFYRIFLFGRIPTTIPYEELQNYFIENGELNDISYGISLQMFGFVISELCRSKSNLGTAFRHTKYTDSTSYKAISIKDLPKYIAPNSSIGSENWDNGVIGAIMHPTDKSSPLESLLMGSSNEPNIDG